MPKVAAKPVEKKEKAEKAEKAPKKTVEKADKPKKAPGAYMNFCKETRPKIVAASPDLTFGEIGKALGVAWKKLSDSEKAEYKKA